MAKTDFLDRDIKTRNATIYKMRKHDCMTLQSIADVYDLTPERVRQIVMEAERGSK